MNLCVSRQCVMYCSVAVVKLSVLRPYLWSRWKRYGALLSLHYRRILISDCLLSIMTLDSCTSINNRSTMIDLLMTNYLLLIISFDLMVLTLTYMIFMCNNLLMMKSNFFFSRYKKCMFSTMGDIILLQFIHNRKLLRNSVSCKHFQISCICIIQ